VTSNRLNLRHRCRLPLRPTKDEVRRSQDIHATRTVYRGIRPPTPLPLNTAQILLLRSLSVRYPIQPIASRMHVIKGFCSIIAIAASLSLLTACGPIRTIGGSAGSSSRPSEAVSARGDWDDVPAAVAAAVRNQEVAIVSRSSDGNQWTFTLLTIRDEPGQLVATSLDGAIALRCTLGHFGDADREKQLLDRTARRLSELAGVGARPLRW